MSVTLLPPSIRLTSLSLPFPLLILLYVYSPFLSISFLLVSYLKQLHRVLCILFVSSPFLFSPWIFSFPLLILQSSPLLSVYFLLLPYFKQLHHVLYVYSTYFSIVFSVVLVYPFISLHILSLDSSIIITPSLSSVFLPILHLFFNPSLLQTDLSFLNLSSSNLICFVVVFPFYTLFSQILSDFTLFPFSLMNSALLLFPSFFLLFSLPFFSPLSSLLLSCLSPIFPPSSLFNFSPILSYFILSSFSSMNSALLLFLFLSPLSSFYSLSSSSPLSPSSPIFKSLSFSPFSRLT